jgi:muconolactone delta-isomerase
LTLDGSELKSLFPTQEIPRFQSQDIRRGNAMKYMITWNERSQGSAIEYEKAQQRILDVFRQWQAPANFKIEMFVIRVGDWGGYMLVECDDPVEIHKLSTMLPAFTFEARVVIPIEDAVRSELEVMAWRDSLKFE